MREYVGVALKGAAMGAVEVVPGVSGGTMALVLGIYDRLVRAIASLHPRLLTHIPFLHRRHRRRVFAADLRTMDIPFLLALGAGMAAAVILLARGIETALAAGPGPTYAFFIGLIAASAVILYRQVELLTLPRVVLAIGSIAIAFVLSGLAADGIGHSLPVVFVAGAIAITALVLPGVSGAFLLLALGQYEFMLGTLNQFVDHIGGVLLGTRSASDLIDTAIPVIVFLTGAVIGLLTVAHAVSYALRRAKQTTLVVLISLMVGALRLPFEEVATSGQLTGIWLLVTVIALFLGVGLIVVFDATTGDIQY